MNNTPIKSVDDLEDFLDDMGAELGMPDADDEDAYKSECSACGWQGQIMETVFHDGEFYCPKCNHQYQTRTE